MSQVFPGDSWQHAKNGEDKPPTRMELQRESNTRYVLGEISLEQWRKEFDRLSEPTRDLTGRK